MNILEITILIGLGSMLAGFLGALTGLGGGVVIVPMLTLGLGVDIRYAIGASLVSVIATSSGAAVTTCPWDAAISSAHHLWLWPHLCPDRDR